VAQRIRAGSPQPTPTSPAPVALPIPVPARAPPQPPSPPPAPRVPGPPRQPAPILCRPPRHARHHRPLVAHAPRPGPLHPAPGAVHRREPSARRWIQWARVDPLGAGHGCRAARIWRAHIRRTQWSPTTARCSARTGAAPTAAGRRTTRSTPRAAGRNRSAGPRVRRAIHEISLRIPGSGHSGAGSGLKARAGRARAGGRLGPWSRVMDEAGRKRPSEPSALRPRQASRRAPLAGQVSVGACIQGRRDPLPSRLAKPRRKLRWSRFSQIDRCPCWFLPVSATGSGARLRLARAFPKPEYARSGPCPFAPGRHAAPPGTVGVAGELVARWLTERPASRTMLVAGCWGSSWGRAPHR